MLAGSGGTEEVKGFLDFQHDDLRHLLQDRQLGIFADSANFLTKLERLGIVKTQIKLLLQRIGVLVSAHADVSGKKRGRAFDDVDVHYAGAQIQERYGG